MDYTRVNFDFDTVIDRRASDAKKWAPFRDRDVIPMPVADMDFRSPQAVLDALKVRVEHGVFGYPEPPDSLVESVTEMLVREHNWSIDPEWIIWLSGLVVGLNVFTRMQTQGCGVGTVTPIYSPFLQAAGNSGRILLKAPLLSADEDYRMDWDALGTMFASPQCHAFMLSNPHNPSGRVYTHDELHTLAVLAEKHDVMICSDEIHSDLILEPGCKHIPFATLSPETAARTVTLMSPSKTFNLAGLRCAFAIIPDPTLRARYKSAAHKIGNEANALGMVACEAAYRHGRPWQTALVNYLRDNRDRVQAEVDTLPGLRLHKVEATYLAWIDCRALQLKDPCQHVLEHGLSLTDGRSFGGPGHLRLNFGCPRATLEQGLARLRNAVEAVR